MNGWMSWCCVQVLVRANSAWKGVADLTDVLRNWLCVQETLAGALKMCGCTDRAGKPVLLVSYNDNIVRLYDLPT
jgi:hypothetical protein